MTCRRRYKEHTTARLVTASAPAAARSLCDRGHTLAKFAARCAWSTSLPEVARIVDCGFTAARPQSHAIYAEQRLILNNGSHRAFTLRQMGVTHVPCVVQHVSSRDELEVVASSAVRRNPDLYLKHARPPMLKDYFNPQLRMVMPVHRRLRQVTVRIEVEEDFVPAL